MIYCMSRAPLMQPPSRLSPRTAPSNPPFHPPSRRASLPPVPMSCEFQCERIWLSQQLYGIFMILCGLQDHSGHAHPSQDVCYSVPHTTFIGVLIGPI